MSRMECRLPAWRDSRELAGVTAEMAEGIALYLHNMVGEHGRLPARSFYGESFSSLLLAHWGERFRESIERLQECYRNADKEDSQFHWEFNKYAWLNHYTLTGDTAAKEFALPLRFKNTAVTNWTLLRSCTRYQAGEEIALARREATEVLRRYQTTTGLICDQPAVRSYQYHCFSAVMLAEIYELSGEGFFRERFLRAAQFIERYVLESGDALYVGRGQEQSFGYGTLVYLLALAFKHTQDARYLGTLARCLRYLKRHQRADGSFPLVMNEVEEGFPVLADPSDPGFPGWYQYNNFFDYLPFLGVFLRKAASLLETVPNSSLERPSRPGRYQDDHSIIVRSASYEAVVSKPSTGWNGAKGYWTNDLPVPYIERAGERVTPCYGGEQFGRTMYTTEGLPFPLVQRDGKLTSIRRKRLWSWLVGNTLMVFSLSGILVRRFQFRPDSVVLSDWMIGWRPMFAYYLFEDVVPEGDRSFRCRGDIVITSQHPLSAETLPVQYFCGGPLQPLVAKKPAWRNKLVIWLEGSTCTR